MTVIGLDSLNRKLKRLPQSVLVEVRKSMEESARELVQMMRRLVPVDSGALLDSIGWTWGDAPAGSRVYFQSKKTDGLRITVYAGSSDAFYALFVEHGTLNTPAQPFFYVSYRALKRKIKSRTTRAVNKAVKRATT